MIADLAKRIVAAVLVAVGLAGALAGCGGVKSKRSVKRTAVTHSNPPVKVHSSPSEEYEEDGSGRHRVKGKIIGVPQLPDSENGLKTDAAGGGAKTTTSGSGLKVTTGSGNGGLKVSGGREDDGNPRAGGRRSVAALVACVKDWWRPRLTGGAGTQPPLATTACRARVHFLEPTLAVRQQGDRLVPESAPKSIMINISS